MLDDGEEKFDVIIIGAGPAGLNTAIMCATRHLRVLLLEKEKMGGLLTSLYPNKIIPNYPGFPTGIVSIELIRNWLQHVRLSGVTIKKETVIKISNDLTITTNKNEYRSRAIVIATGALILAEMNETTDNTEATAVLESGLDAMTTFSDWFGILVIAVIAAVVIGLVMVYFGRRMAGGRA